MVDPRLKAGRNIVIVNWRGDDQIVSHKRELHQTYPHLPISFSTKGLGGALRLLRNGDVTLAFCLLLPTLPPDVVASPPLRVALTPVVAAGHPLAVLGRQPATTFRAMFNLSCSIRSIGKTTITDWPAQRCGALST